MDHNRSMSLTTTCLGELLTVFGSVSANLTQSQVLVMNSLRHSVCLTHRVLAAVQVLFPESYAETAAWLRKEMVANADILCHCQAQLQDALRANAQLRELVADVEAREQYPDVACCCLAASLSLSVLPSVLLFKRAAHRARLILLTSELNVC